MLNFIADHFEDHYEHVHCIFIVRMVEITHWFTHIDVLTCSGPFLRELKVLWVEVCVGTYHSSSRHGLKSVCVCVCVQMSL